MLNLRKLPMVLGALLCVVSLQVFAALPDSEVYDNVKKSFNQNNVKVPSSLDVSVKGNVVYLKGNVETEGQANAIIEAANSASGVLDVNYENLTVNKQSSHPYDDAYVTAKIKGAFVREKVFGDNPINVTGIKVETNNGVVYLTGEATQSQVDTAIKIAKSIEGVKEVKSQVVVK